MPGDFRILLIERRQARAIAQAMVDAGFEHELTAIDASQAFEDLARPDLVLLDLSEPEGDGIPTLGRIKDDPVLGAVPLVVLTASWRGPAETARMLGVLIALRKMWEEVPRDRL